MTGDLFRNLPSWLNPGHFLVFNDTRVIQARLLFRKPTGAEIEIFCLTPSAPAVMEQAMTQTGSVTWKCLVGNLKRWKRDSLTMVCTMNDTRVVMNATYQSLSSDGTHEVLFSWDPDNLSFADVLRAAGHIPLPPYIHRSDTLQDHDRYQTIYAQRDGSVAAPTAGLHFTPEVLRQIRSKGISSDNVTLHVGAGTFKPISVPDIHDHVMHKETVLVSSSTIRNLVIQSGKEIIPVGTTAARTLETLYWAGIKIIGEGMDRHPEVLQWDPYTIPENLHAGRKEALSALSDYLEHHGMNAYHAETQLMIIPGYTFHMTDGLVTNFHMPGSTLLLLVAALIGDGWKKAYEYALQNDFRFLSYGDACLFFPDRSRI